jgi:hypothetical protein
MAITSSTIPGTVKGIQRGVATGNVTVTISPVNPAKCAATVSGGAGANNLSNSTTRVVALATLTSTSLTANNTTFTTTLTADTSVQWSWQVVEYW